PRGITIRLILLRREVFSPKLREQVRSVTGDLLPHNLTSVLRCCPLFPQGVAGVRCNFCHHVWIILQPSSIAALYTATLCSTKCLVFPLAGDFLSMPRARCRVLPHRTGHTREMLLRILCPIFRLLPFTPYACTDAGTYFCRRHGTYNGLNDLSSLDLVAPHRATSLRDDGSDPRLFL